MTGPLADTGGSLYHGGMRIDCPACSAAYDVPPERVPPGRKVRCARCGSSWLPVALVDAEPPLPFEDEAPRPPAEQAEAAPVVMELAGAERGGPEPVRPEPIVPEPGVPEPGVPEPGVPLERPSPLVPDVPLVAVGREPRQTSAMAPAAAWLLTAVVIAAAGAYAVTRRADVMHAWPPSARAYALVGLVP